MNLPLDQLQREAAAHPYPLLFATISGAHLYGFPSPDSDFDLRGAHILPAREVLGLTPGQETVELMADRAGLELDLVTHDVRKFFLLLLRPNGYVLEQLLSPLIVQTSAEHAEAKALADGCLTRYHAFHYLGFARTQWKLFEKEQPRRVKPLLYVFRVLLTGIHLMRTGQLDANLVRLNDTFRLRYLDELIERKVTGSEQGSVTGEHFDFYEREYQRLLAELEEAQTRSRLPERPTAKDQLDDLLVRLRIETVR